VEDSLECGNEPLDSVKCWGNYCFEIAILSFHKNYSFYVTRKPHVDY
jgi:hypothetical protein